MTRYESEWGKVNIVLATCCAVRYHIVCRMDRGETQRAELVTDKLWPTISKVNAEETVVDTYSFSAVWLDIVLLTVVTREVVKYL